MEDAYNSRSGKDVSSVQAQMIYTSTNTSERKTPWCDIVDYSDLSGSEEWRQEVIPLSRIFRYVLCDLTLVFLAALEHTLNLVRCYKVQ